MLRLTLRLSLALAFAAVLALAGLSRPRVAEAQATSDTINQSIPVVLNQFVPCANGGAGEFITLTGNLHVLQHVTVNDNHVTFKTHFQPQGISGTGNTTGDTYHATGVTQETTTFQLDGGTYEDTFVNNFRLIGQGRGNNLLVHQVSHFTFNNNGELTSDHTTFSIDCQ